MTHSVICCDAHQMAHLASGMSRPRPPAGRLALTLDTHVCKMRRSSTDRESLIDFCAFVHCSLTGEAATSEFRKGTWAVGKNITEGGAKAYVSHARWRFGVGVPWPSLKPQCACTQCGWVAALCSAAALLRRPASAAADTVAWLLGTSLVPWWLLGTS